MHPALQGALLGFALGALLVVYEYLTVKKEVKERAAARHQKPQFEPTDRARITSVLRFAVLLPAGGAGIFWLWSGMT
jgi:hypothetical protein